MTGQKQLTLNICLKDQNTFSNFYVANNVTLVLALKKLFVTKEFCLIYIWGVPGSGKTHLLTACCQKAFENNLSFSYLPLKGDKDDNEEGFTPKILEDLGQNNLVCIDDFEVIPGKPSWEEAIFHTFNELSLHAGKLVIAATATPEALPFSLPDLKSRMNSGLVFEIKTLSDTDKLFALEMRAKLRGLELPTQAAEFMLNHFKRDTESLFQSLDKLDREALAAKRKLTVPFIRKVLGVRS